MQIYRGDPCTGKTIGGIRLPEGARLISVVRDGKAVIAGGETELRAGDQVLAILEPGQEDELRKALIRR